MGSTIHMVGHQNSYLHSPFHFVKNLNIAVIGLLKIYIQNQTNFVLGFETLYNLCLFLRGDDAFERKKARPKFKTQVSSVWGFIFALHKKYRFNNA